MAVYFCVEAVEEALAEHRRPEIFNTGTIIRSALAHQGSQFTSVEFTRLLAANGIAISMDGKGARRDTVFVERIWRSVKYEGVYLHGYESVFEARALIDRYLIVNPRHPM